MFELRCKKCQQFKPKNDYRKYNREDKIFTDTCLDCRKLPCACGCGQPVSGFFNTRTHVPSIFIVGHHHRLPENKAQVLRAIIKRVDNGIKLSEEHKRRISISKLGNRNPMFGKMSGENNINWKGGISPERSVLQGSQEWKKISKVVFDREKGICQRCGLQWTRQTIGFHIHHIVSFTRCIELRTEPSNLVLLCRNCHHWVHSNKNINKDFLDEIRATI